MYICFCFSAWTCLHLCKILLVMEAVWLPSRAITSVLWYSLQLGHISSVVREFFSWQCLEGNFLAVYSGFFGWKAADCSDLSYHRQPLHYLLWFSSVQFSRSVVSDSLRAHGLQHTRLPCPSPTPRVYADSCLLSWWCHPTISSSVVPFSSCLQSFPASGSFLTSQFFVPGGQSIKNFSFSTSRSNEHPGLISFRMDWLDLPAVPRDSQVSSSTPQFKSINSAALSFLYSPTLTSIHDYWKNHTFDQMDLSWQSNVSAFSYAV